MGPPYLASWDDFANAAERLYLDSPTRTRFCIKYRHEDGTLVLKATDDKTILKYRTDQLQDVKKMEKLTGALMRLMVSRHGAASSHLA